MTPIIVPDISFWIRSATIAKWLKEPGQQVAAGDPIVECDTDKVSFEITAPVAGTMGKILAQKGSEVAIGTTVTHIL